MIELLRDNPLLLLFLVAGLGFVLGKVRVAGVSLGVAAVLFAGLAFGALHPSVALPELVQLLGLVLFVYTIGLGSGPGFFSSLAGRGLRDNGVAMVILLVVSGMTLAMARLLHLNGAQAAGLLAGSATNTPALAAVLDTLRARGEPTSAPVVMYSIAYPMGVLFVLFAIAAMRRLLPVEAGPASRRASSSAIEDVTVRIEHDEAAGRTIAELRERAGLHVTFGRVRHRTAGAEGAEGAVGAVDAVDVVKVAHDDARLARGDLLTVVGRREDLERAIALLGVRAQERIDLDRKSVDYRRIFVSEPSVTRRALHDLAIAQRFEAVITRVRRGDVELLPDADTELELGDRIRVVAPRDRLDEVSRYFGDSYKALSEIDIITFSVGIAAGLLLGKVPIPLGGGRHFELGLAGGPLIAGLVFGRLGRLGQLVFSLPYSASLTLRQLGLVLFLSGVGTRAGWAFSSAVRGGTALPVLASAAAIAFVAPTVGMLVGRYVLRVPSGVLLGVVAGAHTQPAALAFAAEQTRDDLPNAGYASVYPLATIAKIVLAQAILAFL